MNTRKSKQKKKIQKQNKIKTKQNLESFAVIINTQTEKAEGNKIIDYKEINF